MSSYVPHATAIPSSILLTDCALSSGSDSSRAWPWCTQPLFFTAAPITVNVTILNGVSVHGSVISCEFEASDNGQLLDVSFEYGDLWPWTGWVAVTLSAIEAAEQWEGIAEGSIVLKIRSDHKSTRVPVTSQRNGSVSSGGGGDGSSSSTFQADGSHAGPWGMTAAPVEVQSSQGEGERQQQPSSEFYYSTTSTEVLRIPVKAEIIPRPARRMRLLWDQFHSIQYPPGYIPADTDPAEEGPPSSNLDWHGGTTTIATSCCFWMIH
jgi:membrane-bound transcription factor site-1 protease